MSVCLLIRKSLYGYMDNDEIFGIIGSCQGLRLRICYPEKRFIRLNLKKIIAVAFLVLETPSGYII